MTIKTKFGVNDDVWFNYEGRVKHGHIHSISIKVKDVASVEYEVKIGSYLLTYKQESLYPTEEKLIKKEKKFLKNI